LPLYLEGFRHTIALMQTSEALERVAAVEEVKAAMLKAGAEPVWLGAQAMASFMQADAAQWKKVADFAKISLD